MVKSTLNTRHGEARFWRQPVQSAAQESNPSLLASDCFIPAGFAMTLTKLRCLSFYSGFADLTICSKKGLFNVDFGLLGRFLRQFCTL
jgi:hypothetical protein